MPAIDAGTAAAEPSGMRIGVGLVFLAAACGPEAYGPPAQVVLVRQGLSGRVAEPLEVAVRVLDDEGRAVPGVRLTASVTGGRLDAVEAVTDVAGEARFVWTLDTVAGPQAVDVSLGTDGPTTRLFVEAHPGTAARAAFTEETAVATGGSRFALPVVGWDRWGNAVPDPPIVSTDISITVDSGRWTPGVIGGVRFTIALALSDTLDVYVHPPRGAYRAQFRVGDTVWVETGTLVDESSDPAVVCPAPGTAVSVRIYGAIDVTRIRRVAAWADTARTGMRSGAVVHVIEPSVDPTVNQTMRYRPLGIDTASSCGGTQIVRPWRFAILPDLADSLVIVPD